MSRYLAAFYHLLISFAVFIGLAYLILFVWYPEFFYTIDGGWEGMRIIIFVDLVLGPLLTLVVFKAGKPGLKFDLTCIGLLQSVCLAAGLWVVYTERPTFFVFYEGRFYSNNQDTYTRYEVTPPDPRKYSETTPAPVIAKAPEDPIEEADLRKLLYDDGIPLWVYERSYQPLQDHLPDLMDQAFDYEQLRQRDAKGAIGPWLEKYGGELEDYGFFPIHSRYQRSFLGIRKSDLEFVDVLLVPAPLG